MTEEKTAISADSEIAETAIRSTFRAGTAPPFSIKGIELGARLGQGGMAVVYEGFDLGFRPPRHVAVKFMDPTLSRDPAFRARFDQEASMMATIHHPNVVDVFSSGEVDGAKYLIMRYLSGGTLSQKIETGDLSLPGCMSVAGALADALAYCHQRGIVHRDLKPGNVMFAEDGIAVLTDFGVAKAVSDSRTALTRTAVAIGAPAYMPPEQLLGLPVTDKADIFALGLTLFQMLTGALPPEEDRVQSGSAGAARIAELLPADSRPVAKLICQCLQGDSQERPTAVEFRALLAKYAGPAGAAVGGVKSGTAGRGGANRIWMAAAAAVVLAALGIISYPPRRSHSPTVPAEQVAAPPKQATPTQSNSTRPADNSRAPARICDRSVSGASLSDLVSEGLKAQVEASFANSDTEWNAAVGRVRHVAQCVREFQNAGVATDQSRQWVKDAGELLIEKQ